MLKKMNLSRINNLYPIALAIIFLAMIPIWLIFIGPHFKKISPHFEYSAGILSLDNFYDEKTKKFEGEHISKTSFKYNVIEKKNNVLVIKNIFNVTKLTDKPIFSVSRIYYIDSNQGNHVQFKELKQNQKMYLFAPRYVNKKPFYYLHVNYESPALMKYIDTEVIDGLTVFKYEAKYQADQTANLTDLEDVPEKKGIKADIDLILWIEPISGWLVKYQDNTVAYFYDRQTGKTLEPWNKFSNRYTYNSIKQQINAAKYYKNKILFIDFGVPLILFSGAISLMSLSYFQRQHFHHRKRFIIKIKHYFFLSIVYAGILLVSFVFLYYLSLQYKTTTLIKIGISQWNDRKEFIETIRGFKDGLAKYGFIEGKNVVYIIKNPKSSIENQIEIVQSFLNGDVDLILALTSSGTLVAKGITEELPIVFASVNYPEEIGLISNIKSSKNNLVGIINYIPLAKQFYLFEKLYPNLKSVGYIYQKGDPESEIQFHEFKDLLLNRKIDVVEIDAIDKSDLETKLKTLPHYDALYLSCDELIQSADDLIIAYSKNNKIPNFACNTLSVLKGSLIGYVPDMYSIGKMAGRKAALILKGAEPSWLSTETPEKGFLIVNEMTAKALGIEIPKEIRNKANYIVKD